MPPPDTSWQDKYRNDPRSTRDLINLALLPEDDDLRWDAITSLHYRDTQDVFDEARKLLSSSEPHYRATGVDILAQLGVLTPKFETQCNEELLALLKNESNSLVLRALGIGFGHRKETRCIHALCNLATHSDAEVRHGVVLGLHAKQDECVIAPLIQLSSDVDTGVRNWATFGLGTQQDRDTLAIRAALRARLIDPDEETRGEALVGLALRKDEAVLEPLIAELRRDLADSRLPLEAAAAFADPRLIPALEERAKNYPDEKPEIEDALAKCKGVAID